jgi:hypothetical protein
VALEYLYQGRKKEELMEINPCVESGLSYSETNYVFMPVPVLKLLLTPTRKNTCRHKEVLFQFFSKGRCCGCRYNTAQPTSTWRL